jgi:anti-sigma factor RsiW
MTRYVDGSLPPDERAAVERHLQSCPPCRDEAHEEAAGRTVIRECAERLRHAPVPPALRARCQAIAHAECHARAARWRGALVPALLAASLVLATAAAIAWVATQRSTTVLAAQLSADHTRCFGRLPADPAPLDALQVEQSLEARYGWDVHVPAADGVDGMRLVEGRRCLTATHGGVPHLLYKVNGEDVSLYIFEGVTRDDAVVTALGHRARIWTRGADTFALVSSSDGAELTRALDYMREDAQ